MSRWSVLLLVPLTALGLYACGGTQAPAKSSPDETCTAVKPGTCSGGCQWDGAECKRSRGVIIDYAVDDAGSPPPSQ